MQICLIEYASPEYDESVALRYEVLRKPLGLQFSAEQLSAEWSDMHLAAFDEQGKIVGILLLTPLNDHTVKMRQVAVLPSCQGKGVGQAMVDYAEELARSKGFSHISLHARETAVPFYLKLSYEIMGDRFEEVGIPHFKMEKKIDLLG